MAFKYQTEIDKFTDFIFDGFSERQRTCFRWVFAPIQDERNFKPIFILQPERIKGGNCKGWALSFFDRTEEARSRLEHLCKDKPQYYKRLGTHIAIGELTETDGVSNSANQFGHFDHFEYMDVDLSVKFTISEQVAR